MVGLGMPDPGEKHNEQYDTAETQRRFEAALRGARLADAKPMKDFVRKGRKSRVKKTAQAKPK